MLTRMAVLLISMAIVFAPQARRQVCVRHAESVEYPDEARGAQIQGTVRVLASIGSDGHVVSVTSLSGHPLLKKVAEANMKQWTFEVSDEVDLQIEYVFELKEPRYTFKPATKTYFDFPSRVLVVSNFRQMMPDKN